MRHALRRLEWNLDICLELPLLYNYMLHFVFHSVVYKPPTLSVALWNSSYTRAFGSLNLVLVPIIKYCILTVKPDSGAHFGISQRHNKGYL